MEITNELLAAYAEGNVSNEEREAVRQYLTENPEELESVVMMMDDYYDLDVKDENDESGNTVSMMAKQSSSDICYSAAAFAPRMVPMQPNIETPGHDDKGSFSERLDDFLDELGF